MATRRIYWYITGFYGGFEDQIFEEIDRNIFEVQENLQSEFRGYARDFRLELTYYDPEANNELEIDVSYIVRPMEDDDDEITIINKAIIDKLQEVSIEVEDMRPARIS